MTLYPKQKIRFRGRNGLARAKALATELGGACTRNGREIEITETCEAVIQYRPGSNGTTITGAAENVQRPRHGGQAVSNPPTDGLAVASVERLTAEGGGSR